MAVVVVRSKRAPANELRGVEHGALAPVSTKVEQLAFLACCAVPSRAAALRSAPRALYHHTAIHAYRDRTIKESAWRKVREEVGLPDKLWKYVSVTWLQPSVELCTVNPSSTITADFPRILACLVYSLRLKGVIVGIVIIHMNWVYRGDSECNNYIHVSFIFITLPHIGLPTVPWKTKLRVPYWA